MKLVGVKPLQQMENVIADARPLSAREIQPVSVVKKSEKTVTKITPSTRYMAYAFK
jgi:hypothetical protein